MALQKSHSLQGVGVGPLTQFRALARMRAAVVFPTPRMPENRYAWAIRPVLTAFWRVWTIVDCPIISSNVLGRYFRAKMI